MAPENTKPTPIQCSNINGLLKYHTLNIKLKNFLRVNKSVTVTALVLLIKWYTPAMQNHLRGLEKKGGGGNERRMDEEGRKREEDG